VVAGLAVSIGLLTLLARPLLGVGGRQVLPWFLLSVGPLAVLAFVFPPPLRVGQGPPHASGALCWLPWSCTLLGGILKRSPAGAPGGFHPGSRGRGWDVHHLGDWPELPKGSARLRLGGDITVAARRRALTIDPQRITQLYWTPDHRGGTVGWIQRDGNSGLQYPASFRVASHRQGEEIYQRLTRMVYRAQAAPWEEWRRLVVTLPLNTGARSAGGVHGVPIHRLVACP